MKKRMILVFVIVSLISLVNAEVYPYNEGYPIALPVVDETTQIPVVSEWMIDNYFLNNISGAITLNQTLLNLTIDGRINDTTVYYPDNVSIRNTTNGLAINNSKYALWENRSGEAYYSYPVNTTSVKISSNLTSSGKNTLAGKDTLAVLDNSGTSSLVTGFSDDFLDVGFFLGNISSSGIGSVAMGYASGAVNPFIISSGNGSLAGGATISGGIVSSGPGSLTWGVGAQTNNHQGGINFGLQNILNGSPKSGGVAMGGGNTVSESYGVAMGFSNNVFSGATNGGIALGRSNTVAGQSSIGFGYNNSASSGLCYLFGKDLVCDSALSATIGIGQNKLFINSTDIIVNGNLTVTQNVKTSGCIIYNGGTLGSCI